MKPGIPWSVKGIEPEVREAAKHAARRAGMTLGEWLNGVILDQNEHMLGASQVENTHPWDNFVTTSNDRPPLNREPAPRPEKPRAAAQERRDDNALRLHDIAQQLADLAQKERESAAIRPYEPARREDEQQETTARILARIDDNERQTVEAFTAVNERLTLLSQQINSLGRAPLPEWPEDVPGYKALESAIRNVVEHIEVSERRSREQFSVLQDRLSGLAERGMPALNGEELLRQVPVLSGLDARLAEILNRIQRAEGSFAERIDGVKAAAEQFAHQAQSSALTSSRSEMRDLETRLLSALRETRAPESQPDIASLRSDMAGLVRRLDEMKSSAGGDRDLHALQVALEQLSTRVAQGPDMRPLAEMERRLTDFGRRLDETVRYQTDTSALQRLEQNISSVSDRLGQAEDQLTHLQTMERAIRQLYDAAEQNQAATSRLAEEAAGRAIERVMPQKASAPSLELRALEDGLRAVRETAHASERRNQETLEAVHETLAQIVAKISELERKPEPQLAEMPPAYDERGETGFADTGTMAEEPPVAPPPLSAGDDFIAAARRAAQAAAMKTTELRAEYAVHEQPPKEKRSLLASLRSGKEKPAKTKAQAAEPAAAPASDGAARSRSRKRLIYAGLVLLMAASFFAYKNYVKPKLPGSAPARIEAPATPPALGKTGRLETPADRIITGTISQARLTPPVSARPTLELPPPEAGSPSLREAAAKGDARAQFVIAGRYLEGQGIGQDMAKAAYWYGQAAEQGLAAAQYRLATLYELGRGVPKNLATALGWYERAAMRGNVKAMHNAAVIAAGEQAGRPDFNKAFRWFKAAAEQGFRDSQFNTAILYERGLGARASAAEAYFWYSLAARQGEADARLRAAALGKTLPPGQLDALATLLKAWKPKPVDESANVVAIVEPGWKVEDTTGATKQSSLTSSWRAPRV